MVHPTVIETLSKRGQQKQQKFHTYEELFSGQSEVAGNKCRAGIFQNTPHYSDASFIYVSRHSVSYHTFLVARSVGLAVFNLTFLQAGQL